MAKQGAYIRDVHLLEQLKERIGHSGEVMSNIDANVSSYFNGVRDTLEGQLDSIRMRLEEAEARLNSAENALTVCYASQVCNEFGELSPSCSMEEIDVESARSEVEKWRMRYEQGQQILGECQQEITGYASGGHALILNMCNQQTPRVCQLLRECIDKLQDILGFDVVHTTNAGIASIHEEQVPSHSEEDRLQAIKNQFRV
jgi:hypothetical protein